jgi:putative hydrolase of the HAD superfamily
VRPERAAQLAELARRRYVDASSGWRVFVDTVPVLEALRAAGWRHVILSNHVPELREIVRGAGLGSYFEAIVTSAATGFEKPHPRAFAAVLRYRRGGERVWMVGDNPEADVAGARRAGLRAVLVRSNGRRLDAAVAEIRR